MTGLGVEALADRLESISLGFATLSRLHALGLLAAPDTHSKLQSARSAAVMADAGGLVAEFGLRYFQRPVRALSWPAQWNPLARRLLVDGQVERDQLAAAIAALAVETREAMSSLASTVTGDLCASTVEPLLKQLEPLLPAGRRRATRRASPQLLFAQRCGPPRKVVEGPRHVATDPIFRPVFSLSDHSIPFWTLAQHVAMPHFWTVCIKETVGAELCALSIVEYDGLPIAFYRDLAKQAWDEMRHAASYLACATQMIPELLATLDPNTPLAADLTAFLRTGNGLPIPIERNLYEAIWNSTLAERLILFQVDTEVPGSARKVKRHRSRSLEQAPDLARAVEYDLRDERDHTRIGRTWLEFLIPDPAVRRETIRRTRLLRAVLMLTAFAHYGERKLGDLMVAFSARGAATVAGAPSVVRRTRRQRPHGTSSSRSTSG